MIKFTHQTITCVLICSVFLLTSGCVTIDLGNSSPVTETGTHPQTPVFEDTSEPTTNPAGLNETTLMNTQYLSPMLQVPVQLVDGRFEGVVDGVELIARIQPGIQFGDLNVDGTSDAAWLLSENTGGSGIFVSLIVVYCQGERFRQAPGIPIDDRPVIHSMYIEDGLVKLSGLVHGPNDPMVNPTTTINAEYTLFGERLVKTRLSSAFGDSSEHAIMIESPVDGEEVSGSFSLKGSMPIGPFENNISLLISDPLTGQLAHEGFMVDAEDMGAPAVFDNLIQVPDVPSGTELLVTLHELSMADGTPIAIDSVRVTVK